MGRRLGWIGLVVALATGAAVRWTLPGDVEDLKPRPDALEYEEAARNLASGQGYSLVLDGGHYPPRYPPGFSLLLVPAMWLTGGEHGAGVWMVLASALAGIACQWAIGFRVGGAASATAAAVLLALAPLHVRWSRAVMSDVPATTLTTALALGGLAALGRGPGAWFALGLAAGLAALLRSTCTLLALPLAGMLVADPGARAGAARRLAALAAGVGVGLLPLAAYDVLRFGSPLADGYHYWVGVEFFAWPNVVGIPTGGTAPNLVFYARPPAAGGALYPWPIAILAAAGCVLGVRRPGPARARRARRGDGAGLPRTCRSSGNGTGSSCRSCRSSRARRDPAENRVAGGPAGRRPSPARNHRGLHAARSPSAARRTWRSPGPRDRRARRAECRLMRAAM